MMVPARLAAGPARTRTVSAPGPCPHEGVTQNAPGAGRPGAAPRPGDGRASARLACAGRPVTRAFGHRARARWQPAVFGVAQPTRAGPGAPYRGQASASGPADGWGVVRGSTGRPAP